MSVALAAACETSRCEDDHSGTTVERYFEETIPQYTPSEFMSHFQMFREAVEVNILNIHCAKLTYGVAV